MNPNNKLRGLLVALAVCVLALPSAANIWILQAILTGDQEVPPNGSQAVGVVNMAYNDVTNMFNMTILLEGIAQEDLTASHIHQGPAGVNGPVIFSIGAGNTYTQTPNGLMKILQDVGPLPESNEPFLLSGQNYVNVHSVQFPGGEIRGQLIVVPEPGTMIALFAGLGLLAARRKNAKR
ncbi:MAG: CHRD domain-containing protein [Fimbriimonadales bacterium]|nr:MAG: CHRD domain-containing protein [Fimbriimonadales bacterium]